MISIDQLAAEQGLDREDVIELLEDFLEYTETEDLVGLQDAFARNEFDAVRERAHSIKGAALNLKLTDVADCARKIEVACDAGTLDGIGDLVQTLAAHIKELPAQIEQARNS